MSAADRKPLAPAEVERMLLEWQLMAVPSSSAAVAAGDLDRINANARATADRLHTFWDNPSDFTRLMCGGGK